MANDDLSKDYNNIMENNSGIRKESYKEKVKHLHDISGWNVEYCNEFIEHVSSFLDSCGYFMSDFNIHGLTRPENFVRYYERDFGTWLLDMALQYNMEQGVTYTCKLVDDTFKQNK